MEVLTNLAFKNGGPGIASFTEFPLSPVAGMIILKDGVVFIYTELGGMLSWYPLSNETSYFIHQQGIASTVWSINHNLNTSDFIFFIYDSTNKLIQGNYNLVDNNTFEVEFTTAKLGKVVVFVAAQKYAPANPANSIIATVNVLPAPSVALFGSFVFVVGDRAYVCTSNLLVPIVDADTFWVEL